MLAAVVADGHASRAADKSVEGLFRPGQTIQSDFDKLQVNLHKSIVEGGCWAGFIAGVIGGGLVAATIALKRGKGTP